MKGDRQLFQGMRMNNTQFDNFKSQLQQLTPQQLRSLQGVISQSLEKERSTLVTDEEMAMISKLFS